MKKYEKCNDDEIFVGNITVPTDEEINYLNEKGIKCRVGSLAYDIHGEKLSTNYMLPLFIKKESYDEYDKVMMNILKRIREGI